MFLSQKKIIIILITIFFYVFTCNILSAQTIKVQTLSNAPTIDGFDSDWSNIPDNTIPLSKIKADGDSDIQSVSLKAGVFEDNVYFIAKWKDSTEDTIHKPYVWDSNKNKYVNGEQREDRFCMQFAMEGDYTSNWFSGNSFKADMWHWKASRTNPLGLVHDKMTIIGQDSVKRAYKGKADNGQMIYIQRPSDQGDKLYTTKRYAKKEKEIMPKYILAQDPQGSITDIKAKGAWHNGIWILEIKRKLNTGNQDDVVFVKGKDVKGGIAVFNHSDNNDHNVSETLIFNF